MSVIRITWQNIFDANDRGELVQRMPVIIGRSQDAHLQPGDEYGGVSRTHARIDHTEDGVMLTDLASKNGTWLNGVQISAAPLTLGDQVQIGAWKLAIYPQIHCSNPDCQKAIDHDETMCHWCGQFTTDAVTRELRFA